MAGGLGRGGVDQRGAVRLPLWKTSTVRSVIRTQSFCLARTWGTAGDKALPDPLPALRVPLIEPRRHTRVMQVAMQLLRKHGCNHSRIEQFGPRLVELCRRSPQPVGVEPVVHRNLSTTLRHRRFLFTDSFLLLWKWRVG